MEPRLILYNFFYFIVRDGTMRCNKKKLGWATDGGCSDIKIFKNYFNM